MTVTTQEFPSLQARPDTLAGALLEDTMSAMADHGRELIPRPDLSSRFARAQSTLEAEDPATSQEALRELSAVLDEAMKAVRG
ncbi:hypothetical protein [Streptomyces sp. PTD9-10]|uniref:hypothetical protein n=1 Tax=Streptomyces sp. PTD9-10 TaxID=3120151 RepID=UPI00300B15D7